jgi:hypothetical protein
MFKKLATFMALVLVLAPVSNVFAATRDWDNGGADSKWDTDANWSSDTEPTSADGAYLRDTGETTTDVYKDSAACNILVNGYGTGTQDHWLNIKDGAVLTVGSYVANACGVGDFYGEITIDGGGGGGGALYVTGTYFNLTHPNGNISNTSNAAHGVLNMNGGLLDIKTDFNVSRVANGNHRGEAYLYGGEIYANNIYMAFARLHGHHVRCDVHQGR